MREFGFNESFQEEQEPDGRDCWLWDYRESNMHEDRIKLSNNLQHRWFTEAMDTLAKNQFSLNQYDHELWTKLRDGYDFSGRDLTITRKQMNHIKQVAMELEQNRYAE